MKKLLAVLFILSLTFSFGFGKNPDKKKLERQLEDAREDSTRVRILTDLFFLEKYVDTVKANNYAHQLEQLQPRLTSAFWRATAMRTIASWHSSYSRHEKESAMLQEALRLAEKTKTNRFARLKGLIKMDIGTSYLDKGNPSMALVNFFEAEDLLRSRAFNNKVLAYLYLYISDAYLTVTFPHILSATYHATSFAKARTYAKKGLDLAQRIDDPPSKAFALLQKAQILLLTDSEHGNEAEQNLAEALAIGEQLRHWKIIGLTHSIRRLKHVLLNQSDSALEKSRLAMPCFQNIHDHLNYCTELIAMGLSLEKLKKFTDAEMHFKKAIVLSKQIDHPSLQRIALLSLTNVSTTIGRNEDALKYITMYRSISDSLMMIDERTQIYVAETRSVAEKQKLEIAILQKEKQLQALTIEQKQTSVYQLGGGILAAILILILTSLHLFNKQKFIQQQSELQQEQILKLEKDKMLIAAQSILKGQEEERSRLARDLHDGLGSILSGIKHNLTSLKPALALTPSQEYPLTRSVAMIDLSMKELRRIATNMMPETLEHFGLTEALREFCHANTTEKLAIEFVPLLSTERFDHSKEIVVYRIIQELVTNAIRHAQATFLLVQLTLEETNLIITVEDNGIGFDTNELKKTPGTGWKNITNRVKYLNGTIELNSSAKEGTSVIIDFYV